MTAVLFLLSVRLSGQVVLAKWDFEDSDTLVDDFNSENTGHIIGREGTAGISFNYSAGNPGVSYESDHWQGGNGSKYYLIELNTSYTSAIKLTFDMYSSADGPANFRMQYKIGAAGTWLPLAGNDITLTADTWISSLMSLPPSCDNQTSVFIRWVMTSNSSASGGGVNPSGITRIDNILAGGIQNYSCFTYGYLHYHTCSSSYSFPSAAGGGLGSTPQGDPGAPDYGVCWKNVNSGDRANWILIQATNSGPWTFVFSPSTGNVNAWIWGPFDVLPNTCADLQNLLDCNNGTGGNPISVSTNVIVGKFYITLVTNPTGTNSIITMTSVSGVAGVLPPVTYDGQRCGTGPVTLTASGASWFEKYEWWDAAVGGNLLKSSADSTDSTFVTPVLSTTTTYYVSTVFVSLPPYVDSCSSVRVPVTATINPLAVAPVSISTNLTNVCFPDLRNVVLTANGGSGATLRWFKDFCCSAVIGSGNPLTIPAPTSTATYYAAWETVCGYSSCAAITITVNAPVTTGSIASDQTICAGDDPVPFTSPVNGTGSGVITYRWESFSGAGPWTVIPGATGSCYDPPPGLPQTTQFRRTTISTEAGGTCESLPTPPVTVFLNLINPGSVGTSQILCDGDVPKPLNEILSATGTGIITYKWEQSLSSTGPWTTIAGATLPFYAPPALSVTTYYRRVVTSALNFTMCSGTSAIITVIVNTLPATSGIYHR